jgi:stromal membrane-associated protein
MSFLMMVAFCFLTAMGNEKANNYWEAELPPNYDRVGIENFIRAKYGSFQIFQYFESGVTYSYLLAFQTLHVTNIMPQCRYEDKRWVPRNGTSRPSSGARDEKSQESPASAIRSGYGHRSSFEQNRASPAPSKIAPVASRMPSQVPQAFTGNSQFVNVKLIKISSYNFLKKLLSTNLR